jgi:hypothetical protein
MEEILETLQTAILVGLPGLLGAIIVLIVGFFVALVLRALVRSLLDRTRIDERLDRKLDGTPDNFSIRDLSGLVVFWLVMLFAIAAALDMLNLGVIAEPFDNIFDRVLGFIPNLFVAAVLAVVAWILATLVKKVLSRLLDSTNLDERLSTSAGMQQRIPLSKSISTLAYWLVWFFFLPAILDALDMEGILRPVEALVQDVLSFLPNLFSAIVILIVGYFVARIVRDIVTNLLASTGLDSFGSKFGFSSSSLNKVQPSTDLDETIPGITSSVDTTPMSLSRVIGLVVYVLILIPVAITALDALNLDAISGPAIEMLNSVLNAIPAIFAAGVLLVLAYFVARFISDLVTRLLAGIGFDRFLNQLGVTRVLPTGRQPSEIIGALIIVAIMLFAATEAADLLGFETISIMIANFLGFLGNVVLGLIVLALGLYLSNIAEQAIRSSGIRNSSVLATIARYAILLLSLTMALRQMGIAEDIITLAFGLLLGSAAVAAAIAFGWGGRELAQRQLQKLESNLQETPPSSDPF